VAYGCEVVCCGSDPSDKFHKVDLTDLTDVRTLVHKVKPESVIHLAGVAYIGHESIGQFYDVNIMGTRNLLQSLYEEDCVTGNIVLASSANVYGNQELGRPFTEEDQILPANDYAVSKAAMEMMAKTWFDKLPICITRPFNYTGIGQSKNFLIPKIVDSFRNKAPFIELGNVNVFRDFSDVRDISAAYCNLLKSKFNTEIFNLCSANLHSINQIIEICSNLTKHHIEVRQNKAFIRKNEVFKLYGSNHKSLSSQILLPKYSLESTLQWMLFHNTTKLISR
jgi:nucleoside-diphosphate-sugar epimerase